MFWLGLAVGQLLAVAIWWSTERVIDRRLARRRSSLGRKAIATAEERFEAGELVVVDLTTKTARRAE